jgi:hypothetical protein
MSSAIATALSRICQPMQFHQLNDLRVLRQDFAGKLVKELAEIQKNLCP